MTDRPANTLAGEATRGSQRIVGAAALLLWLAWLIVFAYVVHAAMPPNPIRLPLEQKMSVRFWVPQGWAFFTRDPREEDILLFARDPQGRWFPAYRGPHASPSNYLGVRRSSRARGVELGRILGRIPRSGWDRCTEQPEACLAITRRSATVRNLSSVPSFCGTIGVALQRPVPWAWSFSTKKVVMPSRITKLEILC